MKEITNGKENFIVGLSGPAEILFNNLREALFKESCLDNFKLHYAGKDQEARIGFIIKPFRRLNIATIEWQSKKSRFKIRVGADKIFSQLEKKYPPNFLSLKNSLQLKIEAFLTIDDDIEKIVRLINDSASYHSKNE